MTVKECAGIMAILETAYPSYYAKRDDRQKAEAARLYAEMFKDDNGNLVYAAVKSIIVGSDSPFPPSIGEIKNKMRGIVKPFDIDEGKAWAMVAKACSNGTYGYQKEFDALPKEIQEAVGSAEQIRAWAALDEEEFQTVIGSNFRKAFRIAKQRAKEREMLPDSVKALVSGLSNSLAIKGE